MAALVESREGYDGTILIPAFFEVFLLFLLFIIFNYLCGIFDIYIVNIVSTFECYIYVYTYQYTRTYLQTSILNKQHSYFFPSLFYPYNKYIYNFIEYININIYDYINMNI